MCFVSVRPNCQSRSNPGPTSAMLFSACDRRVRRCFDTLRLTAIGLIICSSSCYSSTRLAMASWCVEWPRRQCDQWPLESRWSSGSVDCLFEWSRFAENGARAIQFGLCHSSSLFGRLCPLIRPMRLPAVNCVRRHWSGSVIGLHQSIEWAMSLLRPIGSIQRVQWRLVYAGKPN